MFGLGLRGLRCECGTLIDDDPDLPIGKDKKNVRRSWLLHHHLICSSMVARDPTPQNLPKKERKKSATPEW
jgi:hypothetical protein